eukprot:evm.model.NODE_29012_length_14612_cov_34.308582.2
MRLGADILLMCPLHHSYRHNMELPCDKQELSVPSSLSDSFGAAGVQAPHSAPAPQRYRSKYRLLACHRDDVPAKANEMRVTYQGPVKSYMGYAMALFEERGARAVALKGMGRAIHKALAVAEILKRRVPGLHQRTEIGSLPFKEVWAPLEEGLNRVESTRYISSILITLSKDPPSLDIRSRPGYQPPLPLSEVRYPLGEYQRPYSRGGRNGGGRGRGGREGGRRGIGGGGGGGGERRRRGEEKEGRGGEFGYHASPYPLPPYELQYQQQLLEHHFQSLQISQHQQLHHHHQHQQQQYQQQLPSLPQPPPPMHMPAPVVAAAGASEGSGGMGGGLRDMVGVRGMRGGEVSYYEQFNHQAQQQIPPQLPPPPSPQAMSQRRIGPGEGGARRGFRGGGGRRGRGKHHGPGRGR